MKQAGRRAGRSGKRIAYIGLGANLDDRRGNCRRALELVAGHPDVEVKRCSPFYETEPVGTDSRRWFVNAVSEIETTLDAAGLLDVLLNTEKTLGRDRSRDGEDRCIDLDLLYMEGVFIAAADKKAAAPKGHRIIVPHPRLAERRFVLAPWADLAPDLRLPWGKTVSELLEDLPDNGPEVRRLPETGEENGS